MNLAAIAVPDIGATPSNTAAPQESGGRKRKTPENAATNKGPDAPIPPRADETSLKRLLGDIGEPEKGKKSQEADSEFHRRKIILKLKAYGSAFPEVAGEILKSKNLEDLDNRQLEMLLNEVKFTVGTRTSGIVTSKFSNTLLVAGGYLLTQNTSLKLDGPRIRLHDIAQSKDYQDLLKELTLEYADWVYSKPENRFAAYMADAIFNMHSINTAYLAEQEGKVKEPEVKKRKTEEEPEQVAEVAENVIILDASTVTNAIGPLPTAQTRIPTKAGVTNVAAKDKDGFEMSAPPPPKAKPAPRPAPAGRGK